MTYRSTRKQSETVDFETALFAGLAPDGGLYMPTILPKIHSDDFVGRSLPELGIEILKLFIEDEIPTDTLSALITDALSFPMPLKTVGDQHVLELFHGPTMAFKDVAAQVLARLMEYFLLKNSETLTLLVATSGDTGGAVAQAFGNRKNIRVVILFPKGKVSAIQEQQLTDVEQNIYSIEVEGSFDDCQHFVKEAFQDPDLKNLNLSTANSINIGRLLPQIIYYAHTSLQFRNKRIRFVVPSGNMGNVTAGILAKIMGFPIDSFLIACNANDPVVEYYEKGEYQPQKSIQTLSNAMDIGAPSNFERILDLYQNDYTEFKKDITAISISDDETIQTIKEVYEKYQYVLDPHTAVAWCAASKKSDSGLHDVIVSTASPMKFAKEIQNATGIEVSVPKISSQNDNREKTIIQNDFTQLKKTLLSITST